MRKNVFPLVRARSEKRLFPFTPPCPQATTLCPLGNIQGYTKNNRLFRRLFFVYSVDEKQRFPVGSREERETTIPFHPAMSASDDALSFGQYPRVHQNNRLFRRERRPFSPNQTSFPPLNAIHSNLKHHFILQPFFSTK